MEGRSSLYENLNLGRKKEEREKRRKRSNERRNEQTHIVLRFSLFVLQFKPPSFLLSFLPGSYLPACL